MTEENTQATTPEATPAAETPAPSLEDVYAEFKIEPSQRRPEQSATKAEPAEKLSFPDPITDTDGFRKAQAQLYAALQNQTAAATQKLEAFLDEQKTVAEQRELEAVVGSMAKKAEVSEEFRDLIKYALADKYATDPRLRAIYDNRHSNPKAWAKAQEALVPELRKKFSIKVNETVADSQRAMREAMRSVKSAPAAPTDEMDNLSDAAFMAKWERMRNSGR